MGAGRSASPAEMPQSSRELMSGRPASGSIAEEANAAAAGLGVQPWAEELGGQIWRLGSALRRVVQVQLEQQQHLKKCFVARESSGDRSPSPVPSGDNVPAAPSRPPPPSNAVVPQQGGAAVQRHAMIVSLYEELQRLEDGLLCSATVVAAAARV